MYDALIKRPLTKSRKVNSLKQQLKTIPLSIQVLNPEVDQTVESIDQTIDVSINV